MTYFPPPPDAMLMSGIQVIFGTLNIAWESGGQKKWFTKQHCQPFLWIQSLFNNPLTPVAFWWFLGWISAKLALVWSKMHLQHNSLPLLPLALCFMTFWLGCVQKSFKFCFRLSFFSCLFFSFLLQWLTFYWACLRLKKNSKKKSLFTMELPGVVAGNFPPSFTLNFLSTFVHISDSIRSISLIWASLERSFPPAEIEYKWCQFWS